MWQQPGRQGYRKRVLALVLSLALVGILVAVGIWATLGGAFNEPAAVNPKGTNTQSVQVTPTAAPPVSPLLFGTNMGLFNTNDQVLISARTRSLLQQMHIRIIRMPVRSSLPEATEIQAAQAIKSLGAVALVDLHGPRTPDALALDSQIIKDMNRVFGTSIVYYEFGNEDDWNGVDVIGYINSWNKTIPQLKRLALQGHFVGPVLYQYDRAYLTAFLQNARPRPDEVSWHEYTCDDNWTKDVCISHIDNWTTHVKDARASMTSAIGTALPIMITEWNYAPNAVPNDGKNNDLNFMTTWTTKALQTLAANRIFASMQYSCTNTVISLISDNATLTTQGQIFQSQYEEMIIAGKQPAGVPTTTPGGTPVPTQAVVFNKYQSFSFEDGSTDGWAGHSAEITGVQNSSAFARNDKHSLQVNLSNMTGTDFPYVAVGRSNLAAPINPGQTITAYAYIPGNSVGFAARLFVMDDAYRWSISSPTQLQPGTWNRLTFTVPSTITGQIRLLGIQLNTTGSTPITTSMYIDDVSWA